MLNDKEKQLILKLRNNSRANIKEIAKQMNCPISTMYDLLHRLEEKKVITYTSKISFEKMGYPIHMFIIAKTNPENSVQLKEYLLTKKNINSIHTINHRSNFHIECIFSHQREVEDFLEELEAENVLTQLSVYTVIETINSEKFLTEPEHFVK
jgi:DNA-binding Lrp family transcriptional regulator